MANEVRSKSIVWCKIPKAGLGNQLFPIIRATVFAHLHQLPIIYTGYHQLRLGPYLRGERSKRKYSGFFIFQKSFLRVQWDLLRIGFFHLKMNKIKEPIDVQIEKGQYLYLFESIPHWSDYFKYIKPHRSEVLKIFQNMLDKQVMLDIGKLSPPVIGLHIRMGDFRKLREGEDFNKVGAVRTPMSYFIDVLNRVRTIHGSPLRVSVFTDGHENELSEILALPNVELVKGNTDIVDMLLLSQSKIIITSAGSTFSYWSGFLSEAAMIMHPGHIHQSIRPIIDGKSNYEGEFKEEENRLVHCIKSIYE